MSTALTQHPWKRHGLCGHHLHSEKGRKATSSWESPLEPNVTAPEIRVDNNIPVILGLPLNAASAYKLIELES